MSGAHMSADGSPPPRVALRGLHKDFGTLEVLRASTWRSPPARSSASSGRPAPGKSTMLRCINLLEEPTGGKVEIDGIDITAKASTSTRCAPASAWSSSSSTCSRT
jgi:ABC-type histidine transport system ATPase subunit